MECDTAFRSGRFEVIRYIFLYIFDYVLYIFLYILYLIFILKILWELIHYILASIGENSVKLSIFDNARYYILEFSLFGEALFALLLTMCVLVLCLVVTFIYTIRKNEKVIIDFKLIALFCILSGLLLAFVSLLFYYPRNSFILLEKDTSIYSFERLLNFLILFILIFYIIYKRRLLRRIVAETAIENVKDHPWRIGVFLLSLFFYIILCFFNSYFIQVTEVMYSFSVFILPLVALVISAGFFSSGYLVSRIIDKSLEILSSLGVKIRIEEKFIKKFLENSNLLFLDFLVAFSSYFFLKGLLKIRTVAPDIFPEDSFVAFLDSHLLIILIIPLYIFLLNTSLIIFRDIYIRIYTRVEKNLNIPPNLRRKRNFVNIFVQLTKIIIVIFIIVDISNRGIFLLQGFLRPPFYTLISLSIGILLGVWLLISFLDIFFEEETVEIGPNIGKIKNVGILFTRIETVTGEQIYIPNIELILKKIKRLNIRKPRNGMSEERGITIHFLFEIPIDVEISLVQEKFTGLFNYENKKSLKKLFENIKYEITDEELDYIFSKERSRPFVLIEDFKSRTVVYKFNFHVKNAFYVSILRSFFMEKFKEEMAKILRKRWENY